MNENEPSQGGSHDVDASVFLDGPGITKCDYCGLPFAPLYDGDRICSECRKKGSEDND